MRKSRAIAVSGLTLALLAGAPVHADVYTITVDDLIPGGPATGQPLTPPLGVVHDATYSLFQPGAMATPGLELLAEEGDPTLLASEASGAGVGHIATGTGPFFTSVSFTVEGDPGDLVSVVTMLARTNDLITGVHDVVLPNAGSVEFMTNVYDAGTEENSGLIEHIPFYGNNFTGIDESQPIAMIDMYSVLDDPDEGRIDYVFPPSARITIARGGASPVEATTWGGIKSTFSQQ